MRKIFLLCANLLLVTVMACHDKQGTYPQPAISFDQTITDLKNAETNNFISEDLEPGAPTSLKGEAGIKEVQYKTSNNDTITYCFTKDRFFSTKVLLNDTTYTAILKDFQNKKDWKQLSEDLFVKNETVLRVGQEDNHKASLLYLNNSTGDIEFLLKKNYYENIQMGLKCTSNNMFEFYTLIALYDSPLSSVARQLLQ